MRIAAGSSSSTQPAPGVSEIHDLHIWAMSTTEVALTVHLVRPGATRVRVDAVVRGPRGARLITFRRVATGRTVRQCHQGEILDFVLENYDRVVESGEGLIDLSVDISSSKRFLATEVLFLPFSEVGVAVTDILVYSHYIDTQPGTAH